MSREILECPYCPRGKLMPVLGSGHPQADVLMLKHSPMSSEIEEGVAFYGRSGNALMKSFKRLGIDPLVVYGTLCVKCPVAEPDLAPQECVARLVEEIAIVQPKIVVVMGEPSLRVLNGLQRPPLAPDRAARGRDPGLHPDHRRPLRPGHRRKPRRRGRQAALLARLPHARHVVRGPAAVLTTSASAIHTNCASFAGVAVAVSAVDGAETGDHRRLLGPSTWRVVPRTARAGRRAGAAVGGGRATRRRATPHGPSASVAGSPGAPAAACPRHRRRSTGRLGVGRRLGARRRRGGADLLEERHALDVGGLGEHVDRADAAELVAGLLELGGVRGQGRRVAGDVDDLLRLALDQPADDFLREAGAGRVDDDDVGLAGLLEQGPDAGAGVGGDELGVLDPVALGVALGVFDRLGDDLESPDLARLAAPSSGRSCRCRRRGRRRARGR